MALRHCYSFKCQLQCNSKPLVLQLKRVPQNLLAALAKQEENKSLQEPIHILLNDEVVMQAQITEACLSCHCPKRSQHKDFIPSAGQNGTMHTHAYIHTHTHAHTVCTPTTNNDYLNNTHIQEHLQPVTKHWRR